LIDLFIGVSKEIKVVEKEETMEIDLFSEPKGRAIDLNLTPKKKEDKEEHTFKTPDRLLDRGSSTSSEDLDMSQCSQMSELSKE